MGDGVQTTTPRSAESFEREVVMAGAKITIVVSCEGCGNDLDCEVDMAHTFSNDTISIDVSPCPHCMRSAEDHGAHVGYMRGRESMGGKR